MLSLVKKAKFLLGGNFLFAISQWLILVLISYFADSTAVGEYTYALALVTPIFMLTNLQLRPIVVSEYQINPNFNYAYYFSLRFYSIFFAIFMACLLAIILNYNIFDIVFLVSLIKALEAISDIIYAFYNAKGETNLISFSLIVKAIMLIMFSYVILYFFNILYIALIGIILVYIIVLTLVDLKNIENSNFFLNFDINKMKSIIFSAIPLGISVMLVALQNSIPRLFLEKYFDLEQVGVFSVFYYFVIIGGIVISSVCQFFSPKFSIFFKNDKWNDLFKLVFQLWGVAVFLGIGGLLLSISFGSFLIKFIYGEKYLIWIDILNIIMISGLFTYLSVVNGYLMTSLGLIRVQLPLFFFLSILTVIISCFFIPSYGLMGASWVVVISMVAQFLLSTLILYFSIVRIRNG